MKKSTVQLASVGLAQARPNYTTVCNHSCMLFSSSNKSAKFSGALVNSCKICSAITGLPYSPGQAPMGTCSSSTKN